MKKGMLISLITGLLIVSIYYWSNHRQVQVIDVHHNTWTAEIVVDHFPFSKAARIEWWENNNESILKKYNIPEHGAGGPDYFTIYAFGKGYQQLAREDRLCFDDIKPPYNCIDKNILMTVNRDRNGDVRFSFENAAYIKKNGRLIEIEKAP